MTPSRLPHEQGHRAVGQQVGEEHLRAVVDRLVVGEHVVPGARPAASTVASPKPPAAASSPAARVATVTTRGPSASPRAKASACSLVVGSPAYVVPSPTKTAGQVAAHAAARGR